MGRCGAGSRWFHKALWVCAAASVSAGCNEPSKSVENADQRVMLEMLMPRSVRIVGPFTKLASFDADEAPDGLDVLLRALDGFGDPVKISGTVRIELYEFVPASGEPKGARIGEPWNIPLVSEQDQRTYWNRTTQMYEFKLQLNVRAIKPAQKYVLGVTYTTPLGDRMMDEYTLELPPGEAKAAGQAKKR
jgi:hypothetical protein